MRVLFSQPAVDCTCLKYIGVKNDDGKDRTQGLLVLGYNFLTAELL